MADASSLCALLRCKPRRFAYSPERAFGGLLNAHFGSTGLRHSFNHAQELGKVAMPAARIGIEIRLLTKLADLWMALLVLPFAERTLLVQ